MGTPVIQTGFSSGELSPAIYGKVDIDAYHTGAATMRNIFVDYRSGASSRPGTAFVGPAGGTFPDPPRLIPFRYSAGQAYAIVLGQNTARFIYNGAYVVEAAKPIIAATNAASCSIEATAHGYSNGDLIFITGVTGMLWPSNANSGLNARFFQVAVVDANDFTLVDWITGEAINSSTWSAWVAGGTCARIYTVATPYAASDLRQINICQSGDVLTLTHPSYPPANLAQVGAVDWTYTVNTFGSALTVPAGFSGYAVGNAWDGQGYIYKYCVTAYDDDTKDESIASNTVTIENLALNTKSSDGTIPANNLLWEAVPGATRYNVYAQTVQVSGNALSLVSDNIWGYIGQSASTGFTDNNVAPDFSQSPPIDFNPFSASGINGITVTSPAPGTNPPTLLGLISPTVAYSGGATSAPGFAVRLSSDGWGNLNGGGASISVTAPGDGLPPGGGNVTITDQQPGPGSGLTCAFQLAFLEDPLTSAYQISNACLASAFTGGRNYHPLLNSQMAPGNSALAFSGSPAVPASSYNPTSLLGTGYLQGGAAVVRWAAGGVTGYAQGNIQLLSGITSGMSVTTSSAAVAGVAPTSYTWSIAYDDMAGNIVTVSGSVAAGVQGATSTATVPYASYVAPTDGYGPLPYTVAGTAYPFAAANFSNPPTATGTYSVSGIANYPGVCFYFQGRKGYASSIEDPQTVWMTKPNLFQNMDYSNPSQDGDAIDITINAQDLSTITSATAMSQGLMLLTADGAWMVTGGGLYEPVTPSTINAQPQSFSGASGLQPLRIGMEVFYVQARGYAIKRLTFSIYVNAYVPTDVSALSSHLFEGRQITEWTYAEQPYYLIWALRDDGILVSLTYLQEQQIQGWARHDTQGYFRSIASIPQVPEGAG